MPDDPLDSNIRDVIRAIVAGKIVPFFGAGVNLCDRQSESCWNGKESSFLPSGYELSCHLAEQFSYPKDEYKDLAKVSEFVELTIGSGPLYDKLHDLFDRDYSVTSLHCFFADLPKILSKLGYAPQPLVIVTTNYDDLMEQALTEQEAEFDTLSYIAKGCDAGRFLHRDPGGNENVVKDPNVFNGIPLDDLLNLKRPVVLKLHGAVKRQQKYADDDSYVISEDDYI